MRRFGFWVVPLVAMACSGDGGSDDADDGSGDGDGDGLSDGEELGLGSDPGNPDSDGDGYRDGDEVVEGHSPTDAEDRIYIGNWPYNPNKDAIVDPGLDGIAAVGAVPPRFVWTDQFGQPVDLYDFGGQDKYVVLDLSGMWCFYCHELAKWFDGQTSVYENDYAPYTAVREAIDSGELLWITAVDSNLLNGPASQDTIDQWYAQHPNPNIPVLLDPAYELLPWISQGNSQWFYPSYVVMDAELRVILAPSLTSADPMPALAALLE
ncbi:MAG: thrombospondin type 3 repeat-containing protein [Myxococcota bacterium]